MPLAHKSAVVANESGLVGHRLDHLVKELCGLSHSQIIGLFDHGCVQLNGALATQPADRLRAGDKVELKYDANQRYHPKPKARRNLGFSVVFEDKHLLVVDKPAELLTVPTRRKETNTLKDKVDAYVRHVAKGHGAFPVHRLDRGVSGLLVFGKSAEIMRQIKDQFAASKPEREYIALVAGRLKVKQGTFESLLATDKDLNRFSTADESIGQVAITHYRVISHLDGATLVQVRLETGRRNQIRVHFAEAGHPVLGDERYEPEVARHPQWPHRRLALHARLLGFEHPISGEPLRFQSPLPSEIERFIKQQKKDRQQP
ncbi:MAG TPA: RluA family pseudouridine synthase [Pirellulaceae bacterium]